MSERQAIARRISPAQIRRKPIEIRVDTEALPLVVGADAPDLDLAEWCETRGEWIEQALVQHGAILLRNFSVSSLEEFECVTRTVSPSLLEYKERSTPRKSVGHDIYTSTEYPAHLDIVQHNENSYASTWPRKIFFYCHLPAENGGETPLADSREVYRRLSKETRELLSERKVMYVRNYGLGIDLSWQDAYQTRDAAEVESYCRAASISWEWLDGGRRLRTRQVRPAVAKHPVTGEWLWFNQAHLFHTSGLDQATQQALHAAYGEEDLPRQTFFGDGRPIPVNMLDEVREVYRQTLRCFSWQKGDVLIVDNMLISHGRKSFTGPRKIYVAMSELWDKTE
jgi:alpha-ketoglutarate-dependent taurine dioxygenase